MEQIGQTYILSEHELLHWTWSGRRVRSICPIHHGSSRTLSIAPYGDGMDEDEHKLAGWGHCHSATCHAKVLVKEWNPAAAERLLGRAMDAVPPTITATTDQMEQAKQWQIKELTALAALHPAMRHALARPRARAYLAGRGVEGALFDLAASLGVGYIPPVSEWRSAVTVPKKWCDRIVFPFLTSAGETGYLGRTLRLWESGMDENAHKQLLDAYNERMEREHGKEEAYKYQIRRWEKTYRSGFFHADVLATQEHLTIAEGPFDALPLVLAGVPDVIAVAGTHIEYHSVPPSVFGVTLAFDSDAAEKESTRKLQRELNRRGITTTLRTPPQDGHGKDWSERYRRLGLEGLAPLLAPTCPDKSIAPATSSDRAPIPQACADEQEPLVCATCGLSIESDDDLTFHYTPDGILYCGEHYAAWEARQGKHLTPEELLDVARQMAAVFPGGCAVEIFPAGYTLEQHLAAQAQERQKQVRAKRPLIEVCHCGDCNECIDRRLFLAWGEAHGWPRLSLRPWLAVPSGEASWRGYAATHPDIRSALAATGGWLKKGK